MIPRRASPLRFAARRVRPAANGACRHDFVAPAVVVGGLMRTGLETGVPVLSISLTPHQYRETRHHDEIFRAHFVEKRHGAARAALMIARTRAELAA